MFTHFLFFRPPDGGGDLKPMLDVVGESGKGAPKSCRCALTGAVRGPRGCPRTAPSSKGKTTDSDSVNRGSNPRGASSFS